MPDMLGFWGMIIAFVAFLAIGFASAAISGSLSRRFGWFSWWGRILCAFVVHGAAFYVWLKVFLDGAGDKYRFVPWWYLGLWITLFSVLNFWFFIASFRHSWSKSTGSAFGYFVRRGGFWGNHFSGPDNDRYRWTRDNFWGNTSLAIWILFGLSMIFSKSPWSNDLKDEQKWLGDASKSTSETISEKAGSAKNNVLSFFKENFKDTNTPIEKALEGWNPPEPVQKYMTYMCPACEWKYDERAGYGIFSPGTAWEKIPSDFMCPKCEKKRKGAFALVKKITPEYETYACSSCGWKYQEADGVEFRDGDSLISYAPGTRWADVSNKFTCVKCGAGKDAFRLVKLLQLYPGTWGWLVAFLLWTPWAIYTLIWSRRDWVADRLEGFADWLKRKKAASVTGMAVSGAAAAGAASGAGKESPKEKNSGAARGKGVGFGRLLGANLISDVGVETGAEIISKVVQRLRKR